MLGAARFFCKQRGTKWGAEATASVLKRFRAVVSGYIMCSDLLWLPYIWFGLVVTFLGYRENFGKVGIFRFDEVLLLGLVSVSVSQHWKPSIISIFFYGNIMNAVGRTILILS